MVVQIAILDAGAQYTKLIDRRIRELNVETVVLPLKTDLQELEKFNLKGIVISGGPGSVNDNNPLLCDFKIFESNIPIFGICYGMQLIVKFYDGCVKSFDNFREDGQYQITISNFSTIFSGLDSNQMVLLTHGDNCTNIVHPLQTDVISPENIVYSVSHKSKPIFGVQFHPEVDLTENGTLMFENFLFKVCNCTSDFSIQSRFESELYKIKKFVFDHLNFNMLVLVSGGVDSTVASVMIKKAIDDALKNREIEKSPSVYYLHVDHGFMRQNESNLVKNTLEKLGINIIIMDCIDLFLNAHTDIEVYLPKNIEYDTYILQSGEDLDKDGYTRSINVGPLMETVYPEHKRMIIGDTFMDIVEKFMIENNLRNDNTIIVQGTLRPDLIESASDSVSLSADVIKTHHNDTEKVRNLRKMGMIFEPLKDFHKDEVHFLGENILGLPKYVVHRHPFPGPGLAIRILCNNKVDKFVQPNIVNNLNSYFFNLINYCRIKDTLPKYNSLSPFLEKFGESQMELLYTLTSNFPILYCNVLPVWSVGVQGDVRSYKNPIAISTDDISSINWKNLFDMVKNLLRMTTMLNRVIFSLSGRIEDQSIRKKTFVNLTPQFTDILRRADHIVNNILIETDTYRFFDQFPVILLPLQFSQSDDFQCIRHTQVSIVLRPFKSNDFMTGLPVFPNQDVPLSLFLKMEEAIRKELPIVSKVFLDITSKPPGTTEWE